MKRLTRKAKDNESQKAFILLVAVAIIVAIIGTSSGEGWVQATYSVVLLPLIVYVIHLCLNLMMITEQWLVDVRIYGDAKSIDNHPEFIWYANGIIVTDKSQCIEVINIGSPDLCAVDIIINPGVSSMVAYRIDYPIVKGGSLLLAVPSELDISSILIRQLTEKRGQCRLFEGEKIADTLYMSFPQISHVKTIKLKEEAYINCRRQFFKSILKTQIESQQDAADVQVQSIEEVF